MSLREPFAAECLARVSVAATFDYCLLLMPVAALVARYDYCLLHTRLLFLLKVLRNTIQAVQLLRIQKRC